MLGFSEGCLRDILEMHARVFKRSQGKASAAVQADFQNKRCWNYEGMYKNFVQKFENNVSPQIKTVSRSLHLKIVEMG